MPDTNVSDRTVLASTTGLSRIAAPEQVKAPQPAPCPTFERLSGLLAS